MSADTQAMAQLQEEGERMKDRLCDTQQKVSPRPWRRLIEIHVVVFFTGVYNLF